MTDDTREALETLDCKGMVERDRQQTQAKDRLKVTCRNGARSCWFEYRTPCGRVIDLRRRINSRAEVVWERLAETSVGEQTPVRINHPVTLELLETAAQEVI